MADRVKYFVLGLLLLVVGGVIAFDRWNGDAAPPSDKLANGGDANDSDWEVDIGRRDRDRDAEHKQEPAEKKPAPVKPIDNNKLVIDPPTPEPKVEPKPLPLPPAPEPKVEPKPVPKPQPKTHVVRSGESLEIISMRYYKTRKGVDWIAEANGIRNKNNIFANQKLIIPARKDGRSGVVTPKPTPRPQPKTIPSSIRVRAGETDLYKICRRIYGPKGLGARVHRVMEMNELYSAEVQPGALLRLPPK